MSEERRQGKRNKRTDAMPRQSSLGWTLSLHGTSGTLTVLLIATLLRLGDPACTGVSLL